MERYSKEEVTAIKDVFRTAKSKKEAIEILVTKLKGRNELGIKQKWNSIKKDVKTKFSEDRRPVSKDRTDSQKIDSIKKVLNIKFDIACDIYQTFESVKDARFVDQIRSAEITSKRLNIQMIDVMSCYRYLGGETLKIVLKRKK